MDTPDLSKCIKIEDIPAQEKLVYTLSELKERYSAPLEWLVKDMVHEGSIGIIGGDSTIGKTSLMVQLGVCVATGKPFLNMETKQGPVVYIDLELGGRRFSELLERIYQHLGCTAQEDELFTCTEERTFDKFKSIISQVEPVLVIVDSLRAFSPQASANNEGAGSFLNFLYQSTRETRTAVHLIHHMKKPSGLKVPLSLKDDTTKVVEWLLEMEGARALVNQTDFRAGVEADDGNPVALNMKWNIKGEGDSGNHFIERIYDANDGQPMGYNLIKGLDMLSNEEKQNFRKLQSKFGAEFKWTEAMKELEMEGGDLARFINRLKGVKAVEQDGKRGPYKISVYWGRESNQW